MLAGLASAPSRLCLGFVSTKPHLRRNYALALISCEHCRSSRNNPHYAPRHIIYYYHLFWDGKMAILTSCGENSNNCEISHFPLSKQTAKVQFSLNVSGNSMFRIKCGKAYFNARASRALKYVPHVRWMIFFVSCIRFAYTSTGKSTFRTQNDFNKAKFRCTADKNTFQI